jgi:hypothetical protein
MGSETSNLVPQSLGRDDSNFIADLLVGLEVQGQSWVVLLNENSRGLLDGFGANTTLKQIGHQNAP